MFCLYFLRWPVRTISFSHTGDYIASASEDLFIDIVCALKLCHFRFPFTRKCFSLRKGNPLDWRKVDDWTHFLTQTSELLFGYHCLSYLIYLFSIIFLFAHAMSLCQFLLCELVKCSHRTNSASNSMSSCNE